MQRVPNPPKLPVPGMDAQSRRQCKVRSTAVAAIAISFVSSFAPAREPGSAAVSFAVHGAAGSRAGVIAEHAEEMRREVFGLLLGIERPEAWRVRCEIHVHPTPAAFAAALGSPPTDARGATSIEFSGNDVVLRRIDVVGDGDDAVPDALDHELVHVVLADHFVQGPPPLWADEGLAILFDAPAKQRAHEADFLEARRRGLAWEAADLVAAEDYPHDSRRQQVFYGQSAALVRWLVARGDAATFIRFLDDEAEHGIERALARHYELSVDSLTSAWKEVAPISSLGLADRRR